MSSRPEVGPADVDALPSLRGQAPPPRHRHHRALGRPRHRPLPLEGRGEVGAHPAHPDRRRRSRWPCLGGRSDRAAAARSACSRMAVRTAWRDVAATSAPRLPTPPSRRRASVTSISSSSPRCRGFRAALSTGPWTLATHRPRTIPVAWPDCWPLRSHQPVLAPEQFVPPPPSASSSGPRVRLPGATSRLSPGSAAHPRPAPRRTSPGHGRWSSGGRRGRCACCRARPSRSGCPRG